MGKNVLLKKDIVRDHLDLDFSLLDRTLVTCCLHWKVWYWINITVCQGSTLNSDIKLFSHLIIWAKLKSALGTESHFNRFLFSFHHLTCTIFHVSSINVWHFVGMHLWPSSDRREKIARKLVCSDLQTTSGRSPSCWTVPVLPQSPLLASSSVSSLTGRVLSECSVPAPTFWSATSGSITALCLSQFRIFNVVRSQMSKLTLLPITCVRQDIPPLNLWVQQQHVYSVSMYREHNPQIYISPKKKLLHSCFAACG